MDPVTISALVSALGPFLIPLIANGITWVFNKFVGTLSKPHQDLISPFLPVFAGAVGTALGLAGGGGAAVGAVSGLAATGIHQMVTQPVKAAQAGKLS